MRLDSSVQSDDGVCQYNRDEVRRSEHQYDSGRKVNLKELSPWRKREAEADQKMRMGAPCSKRGDRVGV